MAWTALSVCIASTMIIGALIVIRPGFWMMDPMCRFPAALYGQILSKIIILPDGMI